MHEADASVAARPHYMYPFEIAMQGDSAGPGTRSLLVPFLLPFASFWLGPVLEVLLDAATASDSSRDEGGDRGGDGDDARLSGDWEESRRISLWDSLQNNLVRAECSGHRGGSCGDGSGSHGR